MKIITLKDFYLLAVVALIKTNWLFSLKAKSTLVKSLAFIAYRLSKIKRRQCEENLALAFSGSLSAARIRTIDKSSFRQIWQETFSIPSPRLRADLPERLEIHGLEHLQGAMNEGKGAILWESSYFGRRLLAKQILHQQGYDVHQVHDENHLGGFGRSRVPTSWIQEHLIRPFFENCELPFVADILYLRDRSSPAFTKLLAERLTQNGIICISADVRRGHKFISVPFLGHVEYFPTGIVSLAKLTGAALLPLFCIQECENTARLIIGSPIAIDADGDREHVLEKTILIYTGLLESYIKEYPEQYRNWNFAKR